MRKSLVFLSIAPLVSFASTMAYVNYNSTIQECPVNSDGSLMYENCQSFPTNDIIDQDSPILINDGVLYYMAQDNELTACPLSKNTSCYPVAYDAAYSTGVQFSVSGGYFYISPMSGDLAQIANLGDTYGYFYIGNSGYAGATSIGSDVYALSKQKNPPPSNSYSYYPAYTNYLTGGYNSPINYCSSIIYSAQSVTYFFLSATDGSNFYYFVDEYSNNNLYNYEIDRLQINASNNQLTCSPQTKFSLVSPIGNIIPTSVKMHNGMLYVNGIVSGKSYLFICYTTGSCQIAYNKNLQNFAGFDFSDS